MTEFLKFVAVSITAAAIAAAGLGAVIKLLQSAHKHSARVTAR